MADVMIPNSRPRKKGISDYLPIAGAIAGGVIGSAGGPGGALAGASTGGNLGSLVGGLASNNNQQPQTPYVPKQQESNAMMRRQQELETDRLAVLRQAEIETANLPEELRQQYLPPLVKARILEEKSRGMYV